MRIIFLRISVFLKTLNFLALKCISGKLRFISGGSSIPIGYKIKYNSVMWRIKSKVLIKKGQELLRKADNKWVNNVEREEIRIRPSKEKERKVIPDPTFVKIEITARINL